MTGNETLKRVLCFSEEKIGNRVSEAETMRKLRAVFEIARKSVCIVKPADNNQGTGSFIEVLMYNEKSRFLFITCNHVLPTNSMNEIAQVILHFEDIEQMNSYTLDKHKNHVRAIWTSKLYDATVVEISIELANVFKSYGVKFLNVGKIITRVEVAILQYPKGKFGIAHGEIDHTFGHDVFYQIGTAPGSSGSPLLDWNCRVLAMHKAGEIGSNEGKPDLWRKASSISAIIYAYLKDQATEVFSV